MSQRPPRLSMRRAAIAGPSSVVWEQSRTNQVLQSVVHPTSNGRSSKLKRPSSSSDIQRHKRSKSSESDNDIIIVEDSDTPRNDQGSGISPGQTQLLTLDPSNVVNHFRLGTRKLQCVFFYCTDHADSVTCPQAQAKLPDTVLSHDRSMVH